VIYAFGRFEIDDERFELRRDGAPLAVQRRTFDLLLHLVRSQGAVVTRDDLLRHVWPGVVVADAAISQAILTVRKALDDDGPTPRLVKTVRGRGYCFDARVEVRAASSPVAPSPGGRGAFVGRPTELAHLDQAVARARGGHGQVVLLLGEQGIGKTRLVDELEARASGVKFVRGHAHRRDAEIPPLWPWMQIARRLGCETNAVDPAARLRFADEVVACIRAAAAKSVLLVALEDVHAAEPAVTDLTVLVARELRDAAVVLVVTARPERASAPSPVGTLARLPGATTIDLPRMTEHEVAALLTSLAGKAPSQELVRRMLEKTGGVPALVAQVASVLAWEAPAAGTTAMLATDGVKAAVADQVASLTAAVARALTVAAVFGPRFALAPLASALDVDRGTLVALLDEALASRVVARANETTYRFTQPLVRDALYRTLLDGERAALHARVARALTESWGPEHESHAAELAPHLVHAAPLGDAALAVETALRAHDDARSRNDRREAARFAELARTALSHVPAGAALTRLRERVARALTDC